MAFESAVAALMRLSSGEIRKSMREELESMKGLPFSALAFTNLLEFIKLLDVKQAS